MYTAGEALDVAVKSCPRIIEMDVRMCNFSKESEYLINESTHRYIFQSYLLIIVDIE